MTIRNQKCVCLHEEPQGIRPGPNAKTRLQADPKCCFCGGRGTLTIDVSHDPPPCPIRGADWNAIVEGSETGPQGYGSTKQEAVDDLLIRMVEVSN